ILRTHNAKDKVGSACGGRSSNCMFLNSHKGGASFRVSWTSGYQGNLSGPLMPQRECGSTDARSMGLTLQRLPYHHGRRKRAYALSFPLPISFAQSIETAVR